MSVSAREQAKSIFADAIAATPDQRTRILADRCGTDADLRALVQEMLAAYDQAGEFLSSPSLISTESVAGPGRTFSLEPDLSEPVGPYRLTRKLGEGGFGLVYQAEQEQPVRRSVAIKIIKPGMDTARVIARFEAERQALAMMDHPAIARVFEAGATRAGRPYFAMELVEGRPITAFAAERNLDIIQRLELFETVCLAVQHAHQKGIIHRDIKPSNILVRTDDAGAPIPKIIDFGIAKATGPALGDQTALTEGGALIGTPEYMSPEQADFRAGSVDTRSDIYSLGVVLYELLTGTTPIDRAAASTSFADLQRIIREVDPPKPSTRLGSISRSGLSSVPAHADAFSRQLKGDLDWVVMKAIEKEPARRYATAFDLAADIRRYLDHKPVTAGPQSPAYIARKFVRRNRVVVAASAFALLALVGGATAATIGLFQAEQARAKERRQFEALQASQRETQAALKRSETVGSFLKSVFAAVSPGTAQGRDTALLRDILDAGASRAEIELADDRAALVEILLSIGSTYRNAALFDSAVPVLQRASQIAAELSPPNPLQECEVAAALGFSLRETGDAKGAIAVLDPAIQTVEAMNPRPAALLGSLLNYRGGCAAVSGDNPAALSFGERAVAAYEGTDEVVGRSSARVQLASYKRASGDFAGAVALLQQVIDDLRPRTDGKIELGSALNSLAVVERQRGAMDKAEALYRESLAVRRSLYDRAHPDIATVLLNLGGVLMMQGRFDEAEPLMRESVAMHEEIYKGEHANQAIAIDRLGMLQYNRGKYDDAKTLLNQAREIFLRTVGPGHPFTATNASNLGNVLLDMKLLPEGEAVLREAIESFAKFGRDPGSLTIAQCNLADAVADQGRPEEALPIIEKSLAKRKELFPNDPLGWAQAGMTHARVLRELHRYDEALAQLKELEAIVEAAKNAPPLVVCRVWRELGNTLVAMDRFEEGKPALLKALTFLDPKRSARDRAMRRQVTIELARLFERWNAASPSPERAAELTHWREAVEQEPAAN